MVTYNKFTMIEINGKKYKLCLFDTNAISSFLKNPKEWILYFNEEFSISSTIISYSIFTLSELWFRQDLFNKYKDIFSVFPSCILDGHESIFRKEVSNYNKLRKINPIVASSIMKNDNLTPKEMLTTVIENSGFIPKSEYWRKSRDEILAGITNLVKNYPPKNDQYTIKEIEDFNLIVSMEQIAMRNIGFSQSMLNQEEVIDIKQFPSIQTTSYVVFYKFYTDKRKPILSDVFDIMISALLPYVDFFITEGNMCEIIKKIKSRHGFLKNLKEYSIKDINRNLRHFSKKT